MVNTFLISDILGVSSSTSSSSSSSSSTSISTSTTSSLVNQFYQQLLLFNLQNSLNRLQTNQQQHLIQASTIFPDYSIKSENNSEQDYSSENNTNSSDISENEIDCQHQQHQQQQQNRSNDEILSRYLKKSSANLKCKTSSSSSTSSLKTDVNELDVSNNSEQLNCSTPIDTHNLSAMNNNLNRNNNNNSVSPLDALLQMANTTFINNNSNNLIIGGNHHHHQQQQQQQQHQFSIHDDKRSKLNLTTTIPTPLITPSSHNVVDIISSHAVNPTTILTNKLNQNTENLGKRKRKNRTAFTAHQIYELEKRFTHQKYLSPSDRDRIAQELSLSTAQVITWFQNRRAKQKRDVEEMKNDLLASKSFCAGSSVDDEQLSNCSFSLLQQQQHQHQQQQHYQHNNKIYNINNSVEKDCHSDSDISLDSSPNTSLLS